MKVGALCIKKEGVLFDTPSFACDLVCIYLSESFDFLKVRILHIVATIVSTLACIRT